jgi:hypothetical protein
MANGLFFCNLYNILKNSLVDIFTRCLSYRLIKIHRELTNAYLLCDKASSRFTIIDTAVGAVKRLRLRTQREDSDNI